MATATLPSSPSFPQFTITSEEISRYEEQRDLAATQETLQDSRHRQTDPLAGGFEQSPVLNS